MTKRTKKNTDRTKIDASTKNRDAAALHILSGLMATRTQLRCDMIIPIAPDLASLAYFLADELAIAGRRDPASLPGYVHTRQARREATK